MMCVVVHVAAALARLQFGFPRSCAVQNVLVLMYLISISLSTCTLSGIPEDRSPLYFKNQNVRLLVM